MFNSVTFADTGGKRKSSPSALVLLTKGMIILGDDWELVDKRER